MNAPMNVEMKRTVHKNLAEISQGATSAIHYTRRCPEHTKFPVGMSPADGEHRLTARRLSGPAYRTDYSRATMKDEFAVQNALEVALLAASVEAAEIPGFYKALMESQLYFIQEGPLPDGPRDVILDAGRTFEVRDFEHDGVRYTPVFSSVARIQEWISEEVGYVGMDAMELFEIMRESCLFLNPGSKYGKELLPHEIRSILDGSILAPSHTHVVEESTEVMIGQPADYPRHLTDALKRFFRSKRRVRAAYLAHFIDPSRDPHPHTLIGLDVEGGYLEVVGEAGAVLGAVARDTDIVDFIEIDDSDISRYMVEETEPFYRKKKFGIF